MNRVFVALCALSALAIPVLLVMGVQGAGRITVAAAVAFPLFMLAAVNVRAAMTAALVLLVLVGDLRRMLIPVVGWAGLDPLLLLGPAFALALSAGALGSGAIRLDTPLARWAAGLMALMALQIFNPLQGGLAVGVAGIIFLMAPLFWFWVGRAYATEAFMGRLLFGVILPLGVAAMLFGYYQKFAGYLPYQMVWYETAGYTALGTPETGLAPISFFASGTEHGAFLLTAGVLLCAAAFKKHRAALLLLLPVFVAILLTGSRGPVVKLIATAALMWAVLGHSRATWVPRGLLAVVVLGAGVAWSLTQSASLGLDPELQNKLDRQNSLFSGDELQSEEYNTVGVHSSLLLHGYQAAIRQPLGYGLGATSNAAAKFGATARSTETDLGDVMTATGLVGGVIYHVMIVLVLLTAVRYWLRTRSLLALALMGVIACHFLLWLGGGLYAVSAIVWVCIGALDRLHRDRARRDAEAQAAEEAWAPEAAWAPELAPAQ